MVVTSLPDDGNCDPPRSARPRVTTQHQDRYITVTHRRNRFLPATVTAGTVPGLKRMSSGTIRNRLKEQGQRARLPAVRPHTVLSFFLLLTMTHADESGGGNHP